MRRRPSPVVRPSRAPSSPSRPPVARATVPTVEAAIVFAAPRGVPFLGGFGLRSWCQAHQAARAGRAADGLRRPPASRHADRRAAEACRRRSHLPLRDPRSCAPRCSCSTPIPLVYDNTGILTVTIRTKDECRVERCLAPSGSAPARRSPPPWPRRTLPRCPACSPGCPLGLASALSEGSADDPRRLARRATTVACSALALLTAERVSRRR